MRPHSSDLWSLCLWDELPSISLFSAQPQLLKLLSVLCTKSSPCVGKLFQAPAFNLLAGMAVL